MRIYVLLLLIFVQGCSKKRLLPHNEGESMTRVSEVAIAVWAYNQDQKSITSLFGAQQNGIAEAKNVISILALKAPLEVLQAANPDKIQYLNWYENSCNDPWGNPYMIAWQEGKNSSASLSIFVWSFGPNGINEFGQGDDIFSLNGAQMIWPKPNTEKYFEKVNPR